MEIKQFIIEKIERNRKQFTNKELRQIKKNQKLVSKIYLLANMDTINAILGGTNL